MATQYDEVINFDAIYHSFQYARRGSYWKDSVIRYDLDRLQNSVRISRQLKQDIYRLKGYYQFTIMEREKIRYIQSLHISDRVVQRSLCDNILIPTIYPSFVYDNGASQKRKGTSFARERLKKHLSAYYRKHGVDGYVLQIDVRKYFDSLSHDVLKQRVDRHFSDNPSIRQMLYEIIDSFGDKGLGLGSQVCQILALDYLSPLDHFVKDRLSIKYFGRYMDDMYIIHHDKNFLHQCKTQIDNFLKTLQLEMHPKKTQIFPIKNGIKFLGFRFTLTQTGAVYMKILPVSVKRIKRKMRKMVALGKQNTTIINSFVCWAGHAMQGNNYYKIQQVATYLQDLLEERADKQCSIGLN